MYDSIKATINPTTTGPKKRRLKKHKSDLVERKGGKYVLKKGFDTKDVIRDKFYAKAYRDAVYDWKDDQLAGPLKHNTRRTRTFTTGNHRRGIRRRNSGGTRHSPTRSLPP